MSSLEEIIQVPTPLVQIHSHDFEENRIRVFVKCDFETHFGLSGNKWRKLKFNLMEAEKAGIKTIFSFGGAYSNHIYALGAVAKFTDFNIHAFIRGEELNPSSNETLRFANQNGVHLHFVSRQAYREKEKLPKDFAQNPYVIPEGGSNALALLGMSEMVDEILESAINPTHICAAMGTGGSVAGIVSNEKFSGTVVGIPALKGGIGLREDVKNLLHFEPGRLQIFDEYHFGGYGKSTELLRQFQTDFTARFEIPLDKIYTAKLFYSVLDLIHLKKIEAGSTVVIYHSGGLRPGNLY